MVFQRSEAGATAAGPSAKRVLLIAPQPFLEWRGSPLRVYFNALALAELGYTVDLLVMPFGQTPDDLPGAITVHRPRNVFRRRSIPIGPSFWKAIFDVPLTICAQRLLSRHAYTVLHGIEEAGAIAGFLGMRWGIPTVFEKHSDPGAYRRGFLRNRVMAAYARVERYAIRRAAAVIVTGPGLERQVRAAFPRTPLFAIADMPSSRVAPDDAEAERLRARFVSRPDARLAAYAGSFALYQGIGLLFDAIPETVRRFPAVHFLIIGGSADEIAERRARLETLGLADRVSFIGRVPPDQLPHYLRAADVLLSPRAQGSNTPLKTLDYLKVGRPIVAPDCEANRLILDESVALLPSPTPIAFAEAIAVLLRDDERRLRMGQDAQARIASEYSYECFRERLRRCYETLLSPTACGRPSPVSRETL